MSFNGSMVGEKDMRVYSILKVSFLFIEPVKLLHFAGICPSLDDCLRVGHLALALSDLF